MLFVVLMAGKRTRNFDIMWLQQNQDAELYTSLTNIIQFLKDVKHEVGESSLRFGRYIHGFASA